MKETNMNIIRPALSMLLLSFVVSACATKPLPAREQPFVQATPAPEPPKPVKIVTVAEPLPLPGQLQPPPTANTQKKLPPQARVDVANRVALQEPTSNGYVNAIQVYPYSEGALYRLYATPQEVSDIALQPGETLTAISAGDTVRWVVGDTTSGQAPPSRSRSLRSRSQPV
jgi:hypothetical protein